MGGGGIKKYVLVCLLSELSPNYSIRGMLSREIESCGQ